MYLQALYHLSDCCDYFLALYDFFLAFCFLGAIALENSARSGSCLSTMQALANLKKRYKSVSAIDLQIDFSTPGQTASLPNLYSCSFRLDLVSISHVRASMNVLGLGQESYQTWSKTETLAESGSIHIPMSERWDVSDLIKDITMPTGVVSSFKTDNVARSYKLRL